MRDPGRSPELAQMAENEGLPIHVSVMDVDWMLRLPRPSAPSKRLGVYPPKPRLQLEVSGIMGSRQSMV